MTDSLGEYCEAVCNRRFPWAWILLAAAAVHVVLWALGVEF